MEKAEFIASAKAYFKELGYKKYRNYWSLARGEIVYCVFMQNSQWSVEDYYVEVGIALREEAGEKPTLGHWYVRKRCEDENRNETNIALDAVIRTMDFFKEIHDIDELKRYVERTPHNRLGVQYDLLQDYT